MIARAAEEHRLHRALERGAAGLSTVVTIIGTVGMGKTSLTIWAEQQASGVAREFTSFRVAGNEGESELALAVMRELFHQLPDGQVTLPRPQRRAVDALLRGRAAAPFDPMTLAAGLLTTLTGCAALAPILLVVDDLHWVDAASLTAIEFVVRRLKADRVVVLLASRPPLSIANPGAWMTIHLTGLSVPQAHSLLSADGTVELDRQVVGELVHQTGGSPLALKELVDLLSPEHLSGRDPLPNPLPLGPGGRASFGVLLRALPARTRLAILVAALAGTATRQVMLPALAALGLRPDDLDPAVNRHVLLPQTWTFTHPLLRSASHGLSTAQEIRRVHLVLAQVFGQADLPRHAWHLAAAAGGVDEPTSSALEAAAELEARRGGPAAATPFWQLAADLSPPGPARQRRLVSAAESQLLSSDRRAAMDNVKAALAGVVAPEVATRAIRVKAALLTWSSDMSADLADLVAEAERIARSDPASAAEIFLNVAISAQTVGNIPEAIRLAQRGAQLMPPDAPNRQLGLAVLGQVTMLVTGRAGDLPILLPSAQAHRHVLGPNPAWPSVLTQWLLWGEQYESADALRQAQVALARHESAISSLPYPLTVGAEIDWWRGNWDEGRTSVSEAGGLARQLDQVGLLPYSYSFEALYALQREDHERAAAALYQADLVLTQFQTLPAAIYTARVRLHGCLATGDLAGAMEHGARADALRRQVTMNSMTTVPYLPEYVEAAVRSGNDRAGALMSELAGFALTNGSAWTRATWLRCTGLAAETGWEEAFEESASLTSPQRTPFEHARTLACWGERRVREGNPGAGRTLLQQADSAYAAVGSALWRRQLAPLLGEAGVVAQTIERAHFSLTDQELKVCLLVAGGATNRAAAHALFLSEKTIEYHLHKAMAKTGAANRTQLARLVSDGLPSARIPSATPD